jgi:hypothetical protein
LFYGLLTAFKFRMRFITFFPRRKKVTKEVRGKEPMVPLRTPPSGSQKVYLYRFGSVCAGGNYNNYT